MLLITNIKPVYRKELYNQLVEIGKIQIYFGHGESGSSIAQEEGAKLKNIYLRGYLIFQLGIPWKKLRTEDKCILLYEFQNITTILIVLWRLLFRKKTTLWTHGLYGREWIHRKLLTLAIYNLVGTVIFYDVYQQRYSRFIFRKVFKKELCTAVAKNSLPSTMMGSGYNRVESGSTQGRVKLLFVGRITRGKKVIDLVDYVKKHRSKFELVLCGDFDLEMEDYRDEILSNPNVFYVEGTYNKRFLRELYDAADFMISIGNVGLNVLQSISYGTPVITHRNLREQNPEYAVFYLFSIGYCLNMDKYLNESDSLYNLLSPGYLGSDVSDILSLYSTSSHASNLIDGVS